MPVDRLYQGNEPIAHPLTGELISLDDRDGLFRAWCDAGDEIRRIRDMLAMNRGEQRRLANRLRAIEETSEPIVYALAGQAVTRAAAAEWSRDQIDQGC